MPKRRRGQRNSTCADIIEAVRQLVLFVSDDMIAGVLNRNGLKTGNGNRWTRERVTSMRSNYRIPVFKPVEDGIGLPQTGKILIRPDYQWRYGYNHQTIYRRAAGTGRFLLSQDIHTALTVRWANTTRIVQITDDPRQQPSDHDAALSLVMASLEIAVRRDPAVRFISHLDILRSASSEAQNATSPLSIPIPEIAHSFASGPRVSLKNIHVKPDALFGVEYSRPEDDFAFYALEFDRSTEDVEPTKNLVRASRLRKIHSYSAISAHPTPIYQTYLKVPNLLVLCIFSDAIRMAHVMQLAKKHAAYPRQFLFKTIPLVDPLLNATAIPQLYAEPWQRIGGTFHIATMQEGGDVHDSRRQDRSRQGADQQTRGY